MSESESDRMSEKGRIDLASKNLTEKIQSLSNNSRLKIYPVDTGGGTRIKL